MKLNIVLVEPEIPQNTGNIVRTCMATNSVLHLVGPLGFSMLDKHLKRAGLDYWQDCSIVNYESYADFLTKNRNGIFFYASTKSGKVYNDIAFVENCYILFGKETKGLNEELLKANAENCFRIPMLDDARSLNLSNAVAIVTYEALRQNNFKGLKLLGSFSK